MKESVDMNDIHVGTIGSFDFVTTMSKAKPQVIKPFWKPAEIDIFNRIKACFILAKREPPQNFVDAITNKDLPTLLHEVTDILKSDIRMSRKLRRQSSQWINLRLRSV